MKPPLLGTTEGAGLEGKGAFRMFPMSFYLENQLIDKRVGAQKNTKYFKK